MNKYFKMEKEYLLALIYLIIILFSIFLLYCIYILSSVIYKYFKNKSVGQYFEYNENNNYNTFNP